MKKHLARIAALRKKAEEGNKSAAAELVRLCRRGMLQPAWEGRRR